MARTAARHRPGHAAGTEPERRRPVMLAVGLALLALAAAFAAVAAAGMARPPAVDRWWLAQVTGWQAAPLTRAGEALSYAGGPWGGTAVVAVLVALLLWRRRLWTAGFLALAEGCGSGTSQLIKHLVDRARPPHPLVRADVGSFPSGHVITTVVVGLVLVAILARPGRRRLPLAGVAAATVIMMVFRTYLRAHWLTDTVESVLVGSGLALVLWWCFAPALWRERTAGRPGPIPGLHRRLPGRVPWCASLISPGEVSC